jgi:hypothetical protein
LSTHDLSFEKFRSIIDSLSELDVANEFCHFFDRFADVLGGLNSFDDDSFFEVRVEHFD